MYSISVISLIFAVFSMLGYGVVDLISFLLSRQADPRTVPLWTTALSIVFIGIGAFFIKFPGITTGSLLLLIFASVIGVAGILSFYRGLNKGSISVVVPIANLWPLVSVTLSLALLGEAISSVQLYGIALAMLGILLVSFKFKDLLSLNFRKAAMGAEYALATMLCWGIFYTSLGFLSKSMGFFWPTLLAQILVGVGILIYLLLKRSDLTFPRQASRKLVLFAIILSVSVLCYMVSTGSGYVTLTAPITGAAPVITVLLGVVLLKNKVGKNQMLGVILIVAGIALISI